jgi:ribosome-associated translation inhibitor RaiA
MADFELEIATRGPVPTGMKDYAEDKVRRAAAIARRPVLFGRLALTEHENPSAERPSVAKATLDVSGRPIRAHTAAPTMTEAVDRLGDRLVRQLTILSEHSEAKRSETGTAEPGTWRHGDLPTDRPPYYPRPAEEREIIRQKTYELAALTPKDAALDMELMSYDFHLFTNVDTGRDAVIARRDGEVVLFEDAPELTVEQAGERLDVTGDPFVFFVDPISRRGSVLYHRYDGHYGLITAA